MHIVNLLDGSVSVSMPCGINTHLPFQDGQTENKFHLIGSLNWALEDNRERVENNASSDQR